MPSVRKWIGYGGLLLGASAISFVKMFFYAKFLDPEDFGIVALVLSTYAVVVYIAAPGITEGLLKLASMSHDRNQQRAFVSAAFGAGLLSMAGFSLLVWVFGAGRIPNLPADVVWSALAVCASALLFNLTEVSTRAAQQFPLFAALVFTKAVLSFGAGASLVTLGGHQWILYGEAAAMAVVALGAFRFSKLRPEWRLFRLNGARRLIAEGLPITLSNLAKKLNFSADRLIVAAFAGAIANAEYGFVMLVYLAGISLIGAGNTVVGPMILARFGGGAPEPHKDGVVLHAAILLVLATLAFAGVVYFSYSTLVAQFYPQFDKPGIATAAVCVAVGMGAIAVSSLVEWFIIAAHRSYLMTGLNVATLVVMCLAFWWVADGHYTVLNVALAFLGVRVFNALGLAMLWTRLRLVEHSAHCG